MHKRFPFQWIFSRSLPTFRKGVHCTKVLHPLTGAVQCAVRFSTLWASLTMSAARSRGDEDMGQYEVQYSTPPSVGEWPPNPFTLPLG